MAQRERLDHEAQAVLDAAHDGARRLRHDYVGTEHLVAALVERSGGADSLPSAEELWVRVGEQAGERPPTNETKLPLTDRLQETIARAIADAETEGRPQIGPADLVIALTEHMGSGAQIVLAEAGADPDLAFQALAGQPGQADQAPAEPPPATRSSAVPPKRTPAPRPAPALVTATRTSGPTGAGAAPVLDDAPPAPVLAGGTLLAAASQPTAPCVIALEGRVRWAYRIAVLDPAEQAGVRASVSLWAALGELPGVLAVAQPTEMDGWLVVDAQTPGLPLAEHLRQVTAGRARRLAADRCGALIASACAGLAALHANGTVHRAVSPDTLVLDPAMLTLSIARLSIADPAGADAGRRVANRYTAPECLRGEPQRASDQFSLAVIALELLEAGDAPPLTEPVRAVLDHATRQQPDQRFETIGAFGTALRAALAAETPLTLADRARRLAVPARFSIGPAALIGAAGYVAVLLERKPVAAPLISGLVTPVLFAGLVVLLQALIIHVRTTVGLKRGVRRVSGSRMLFLAAAASAIGFAALGSKAMLDGDEILLLLGCGAVWAAVAPIDRDAGAWWIERLRVAEWRWRRLRDRRARVLVTVLAIVSVVLLDWLPGGVAAEWPRVQVVTAASYGPLGALWDFRNGLYARQYAHACSYVVIPIERRHVPCIGWAPLVAALQNGDPIAQRGRPIGNVYGLAPATAFTVTFRGDSPVTHAGLWYISPRANPSRYVGVMEGENAQNTLFEMFIERGEPAASPEAVTPNAWFYETQLLGNHFYVVRVDDCRFPAPGAGAGPVTDCGFRDEITPQRLAAVLPVLREKGYLNAR